MKTYWRVRWLLISALLVSAYSLSTGAQTLSDALDQGALLELRVGVSGEVAEVLVRPGAQVKSGQLLLKLGSKPYESALEAARSEQQVARFELQLVQDELGRQQELYEEGSLATVELQHNELQVKKAKSRLAAASAVVRTAEARLAFTTIRAPMDGEIVAVPLVGQRVSTEAGLPVLIRMRRP